jgi:hypothetical protein
MDNSATNNSSDPDAWAIKFIDVMWVRPILEAFDDDASGFITIAEVNTLTSSRPIEWRSVSHYFRPISSHLMGSSLPHWLAYWAVGEPNIFLYLTHISIVAGFKWSIIDYTQKIENLFAKMEGVRAMVLPPNREVVDKYLTFVWILVHTLTAAASSLSSGLDDAEKFKSHLEAEEARLGKNLLAVDYVIDGIDTLNLITGGGRIEKVGI